MKIEYCGNIIEIDAEKTAEFSKALPVVTDECNCPGCRNYVQAIGVFPSVVKELFKGLGIDLRKASEVYVYSSVGKGDAVYYGGFYHLCGKLLKAEPDADVSYKITDGYSVRFIKEIDLAEGVIPDDAVQMEIAFTSVPWVLSEENPY